MSTTQAETGSEPTKPLVFVTNPFDDERMDAIERIEQNWDASYVPGYSEARRENEIREAKGEKRVPMPKLYWARVTKGDGYVKDTDQDMMSTLKLGYRAVGKDDLEAHGFEMPPTAYISEDGLIMRGDSALFMVSADRADRNRERQRRLNAREPTSEPSRGDLAAHRIEGENTDRRGSLEELAEMDIL